MTHGDVTDDVCKPRGRFNGEDEVAPVISMGVARNGMTVCRAGDAAGFREVNYAVDNEVMSTSWTGTDPTRTGELVVSMRIKEFGTRAREGGMGKGGLRETKYVMKEDDKVITWEGIMNLRTRNNGDPGVCWCTKFHCLTFEDRCENWRDATSLLRVSENLGVGEMIDARNVIRSCSVEGPCRCKVWMICLDESRENSLRRDNGDIVRVGFRIGREKICSRGKDYSIFGGEIVNIFCPGCSTRDKCLARIVKALEKGMARRAGVVYTQEITIHVGVKGRGANVGEARGEACIKRGMYDRLCSSEAKATLLNGVTHLGYCTEVDWISGPVHGETEVGCDGIHEGFITRESEGVRKVRREIAYVK
jgi:hypothetical protein